MTNFDQLPDERLYIEPIDINFIVARVFSRPKPFKWYYKARIVPTCEIVLMLHNGMGCFHVRFSFLCFAEF